ncbi:hypothetical protein [Paenibacillus sp. Mc5Re-14]|uniref:hypothetical protein n=1 Tax=Paenibacillus sp. Mc5Re-14 TaxID=1030529 RepID=UPI000A4CFDF6|nr:hypothetical protein [Paenibacillus sp. Mc5Re-14]
MDNKEFKRKMKTLYNDKKIEFLKNEAQNIAKINDLTFQNQVQSDAVYVFHENKVTGDVAPWGRSTKVENS